MGIILAVAGKGGVGKTTLSALMIRYLKNRKRGPILAVDADPNANLAEALGLQSKKSLGSVREEFFETKGKLPPGMTKETYLEMKLHENLVESQGLDLLVMGRRKEKLYYLLRLLVPPAAWLRHYYHLHPGAPVAQHYLLHPLKLCCHYVAEVVQRLRGRA